MVAINVTMGKIIFLILLMAFQGPSFASTPDTIVQLMDWPFDKIAEECETHLASSGFAAVQVSPVQEHVKGKQWWTRYQRVSSKIISRSGNQQQFESMIKRCHAVGIKIYVDFLVNHMTGKLSGVGVGGTSFEKFNYPEFGSQYFRETCDIEDWLDPFQLRYCELAHLADLKTELLYVRNSLAAQMNQLIDLGVDGFRVDAAKHVEVEDLEAIYGQLNKPVYLYHEIMEWVGDETPIKGSEYHHLGSVYEVRFTTYLTDAIRHKSNLADLHNLAFHEKWDLRPSEKALVYLTNHDTMRWDKYFLSYKDPKEYRLAHVFLLAWPYGTPRIMSTFYFEDHDEGARGPFECGVTFVCEHRWPAIAAMVKFRKEFKGEPILNWWSDGKQLVTFNKGSNSYLVINNGLQKEKRWFHTKLPEGEYQDILSGKIYTLKGAGWIELEIEAQDALVLRPR